MTKGMGQLARFAVAVALPVGLLPCISPLARSPRSAWAQTTPGTTDICQLTPDAPQCPYTDFGVKRAVHTEVYAIGYPYVLHAKRFEVVPYFELTPKGRVVSHRGAGLAIKYYVSQEVAFGVDGTWYAGLNGISSFANVTWVPIVGKFAGPDDFIVFCDGYLDAGAGVLRTQPAVLEPTKGKLDWGTKAAFDLGMGIHVALTRSVGVVLEVRDIAFFDDVENHLANDVQLQLGMSLILPLLNE
jgi:hypothetical protein